MKLHSKTSIPSVVAYVSCSLAIFSLGYGFHWPQSISNRLSKFLYCLDNEQWHLTFTYLLFLIHFLTDSLSFSPSHLNIIFSFFLFFFYHHLFFLYLFPTIIFFNEKCYIHNIFCNTLQEWHQNLMWKIVISFNLNPPLKLFFYSPILTNNNLLLKIYCENIVVTFLNCHFLFFILFFLSLFHSYFFSPGFFSTTHVSHSYLYQPFFFFF